MVLVGVQGLPVEHQTLYDTEQVLQKWLEAANTIADLKVPTS